MVCRVTNTLTKESVLTDSFELTLTPVVKADLSAAIAAAEGKQEAGYTPETWEPFAEALEYAKAVLADKNAAQAQVDEAAAELTEKMEALKEKADTSGLSAAIAAAEANRRPTIRRRPGSRSRKRWNMPRQCLRIRTRRRLR